MNIADYKGVWVFAEQREGELQKVSLELLGEGRRVAEIIVLFKSYFLIPFIYL